MRNLLVYLRFVGRRMVADRCLMVAGSLAFTTLLALVPLLTITVTLTANLPYVAKMIAAVHDFALKNMVPEVGGRLVATYIDQFARNAARLTLIGLAIVAATAVAMFFTIDSAFNDIWRAKRRRSWIKRLGAYVLLLLAGPLLIGASLTMTSYLVHVAHRFERVLPMLDDGIVRVVPFLLTTLALVLAYRVMPARHVPLRHALVGGLLAGLLFECTKYAFVVTIVRIPTYSLVYGTFASVPILLVWLFLCWTLVLAGAEVAATLSYFRHPARETRIRSESAYIPDAIRVVDALALAGVPMDLTAVRFKVPMPIDVAEDILHALEDAALVRREARGAYRLLLARDAISDEEIVRAVSAHSD
ncbi:MAG: YihY family inner membrane protein [Betaproteobacteria bacterium]|nr:YihY family inner membrane protein [Betaproteobacteria bacterium]